MKKRGPSCPQCGHGPAAVAMFVDLSLLSWSVTASLSHSRQVLQEHKVLEKPMTALWG